jgi:hypothetical protein
MNAIPSSIRVNRRCNVRTDSDVGAPSIVDAADTSAPAMPPRSRRRRIIGAS